MVPPTKSLLNANSHPSVEFRQVVIKEQPNKTYPCPSFSICLLKKIRKPPTLGQLFVFRDMTDPLYEPTKCSISMSVLKHLLWKIS